ncbi:hypothetical protein KP79_PYT22796 [Mizuhopecten yessoensis]|uniref:Uncharacterized protein n=1 Tax=Mizuhopecten yessoensis TaxID=6573 RepID=A0A210PFL8_MIZYE|nr:hypothetical protein KP79_PYT22796 [Mizuhopecten yessoensis]
MPPSPTQGGINGAIGMGNDPNPIPCLNSILGANVLESNRQKIVSGQYKDSGLMLPNATTEVQEKN